MELILAILVAGPVGFFTETGQRGLAIYLATINVDGTGQRRLTRTAALETNPVWSPDGRRIAFTSDRHAKRGPVHRQLGRTFELYKNAGRRQEHPPAHAQPGPRPPAAAMRPVSANFNGPGT